LNSIKELEKPSTPFFYCYRKCYVTFSSCIRQEGIMENLEEFRGNVGTRNVVYVRHDLFTGSPLVIRR
jgi:hypothetical protein